MEENWSGGDCEVKPVLYVCLSVSLFFTRASGGGLWEMTDDAGFVVHVSLLYQTVFILCCRITTLASSTTLRVLRRRWSLYETLGTLGGRWKLGATVFVVAFVFVFVFWY